jgi:glycosyltransferase involved in cell wall biosynthesis
MKNVEVPSVVQTDWLAGMPKTVTIDARWLVGGIGTYTENLLRGFGHNGNGLELHAIVREADAARVKEWCTRVTVVNAPIYTLWEQLLVPRAAKECNLLHVPHYNVPVLHRGPLIVSIMDVIHISCAPYRHSARSYLYARPMLNFAARKADHVVTVSNYSKAQIVEALGIPETKITVIHCGVGAEFHPDYDKTECKSMVARLGISRPYLLYVGNLKPHKNVSTLLQAVAQLHGRKKLSHELVIVGDDARWKRTIVDECVRLGVADQVVFVPYVSQALLPKIYAAADLLVMPSNAEGFGLPIVEAMACGTPVACSQAASLPEVAGDAAAYFDPEDAENLAETIERLAHSSDLRESLRAKGLQRAKQFTWQEFTRKHIEVYYRLLSRN